MAKGGKGDKVLHPTNQNRSGGSAKQVSSGIIKGPVAMPDNLQPFNRKKGK